MPELRLEIPCTPPSGNHYKDVRVVFVPAQNRHMATWYHTSEAKAWWAAVAAVAQGRQLLAPEYVVSYVVYCDPRHVVDVDNYAKCILDALGKKHGCRAINNDRNVIDLHGYRRIDRTNPRTIIVIRAEDESLFAEAR